MPTPGLRISTDGGGTWHPLACELDAKRRILRTAEPVPLGAAVREFAAEPPRMWRVVAVGQVRFAEGTGPLAILDPVPDV